MTQQTIILNLENAIKSIKNLNKDKEEHNCPYCLEEVEEINKAVLGCGHYCHLKCLFTDMVINREKNPKCCLCRQRVLSAEEHSEAYDVRNRGEREAEERHRIELRERQEEFRREAEEQRIQQEEQQQQDEREVRSYLNDVRQRIRERQEEGTEQREIRIQRYRREYSTLYNNNRINLLETWRVRRNTCGYEILQVLMDSVGTEINWKECKKIIETLKNGYSHDTFRRNLRRLEENGYITFVGGVRYIENIKLTPEFVLINLN